MSKIVLLQTVRRNAADQVAGFVRNVGSATVSASPTHGIWFAEFAAMKLRLDCSNPRPRPSASRTLKLLWLGAMTTAVLVVTTANAHAEPADEGVSLRNGFSLSVGQEFGETASGADISGQLYGLDWRIGAVISEAVSVHLHSHISFGTASVGGASGATGNFATAAVGEYTLPMRLFVGAGAGYGVLNNPNGPLAEARIGYYPFEKTSAGKARRLNVALDARWYFVDDAGTGITVSHIALSLGYDRF